MKFSEIIERASELLLMLERGQVFLPALDNDWKPALEAEWLSWTGDEEETADQIDMAAYAAITTRPTTASWGGVVAAGDQGLGFSSVL